MGFRLREGVSFCIVNERCLFLDLDADRYFGLPPDADAAFQELVRRGRLENGREAALMPLTKPGILLQQDGDTDIAPTSALPVDEGAADPRRGRCSAHACASAIVAHMRAGALLKRRPLKAIVSRIADRKRANGSAARHRNLCYEEIASAFDHANRLVSANERCLQRSLAVMLMVNRRRGAANLVFGVRANPFMAHCWVQSEDQVLTDEADYVRTFTPILVV